MEEMIIKIYNLDERLEVAKILIKNGYQVRAIKVSKEGNKTADYALGVIEPKADALISKRGE